MATGATPCFAVVSIVSEKHCGRYDDKTLTTLEFQEQMVQQANDFEK